MNKQIGLLALILLSLTVGHDVMASDRPNVVWIVVDDMSSHFGYQGEPLADTPNVDRLAREGIVFSKAYATAPVCSTFRSAMITGMYQTSIGAHHHRSSRGELKVSLPGKVQTIPQLFRAAGYFTTNADASGERWGKQDYNFAYNKSDLYDDFDYRNRKQGQPFFAQFQLRGGKLRNVDKWYDEAKAGLNNELVDRSKVQLPPYYPDHPVIREDWAQYLDSVNYTDVEVGRILDRLKTDGVLGNTIVFFLTDHGISHARGKQFLYEEGVLIPFVVWAPQSVVLYGVKESDDVIFAERKTTNVAFAERKTTIKRDDLIAHIDLGATSLQLAGIDVPEWMQGRPLFGDNAKPRDYVVSARDRCDETVDRIRSVRQGNFKYIRNYYPQRPYLQPCAYKDAKPFMPVLRELFAAGKLNAAQSLQLASTRPSEELYDLESDPWEVHNLAADSNHAKLLASLRATLEAWEVDTNDQGRSPETDEMFDSDMAAYLSPGLRKKNPQYAAEVEQNIRLMKSWQAETKPNVVMIISDDQGWADIGYNNPNVYTPNLDRLAKTGATFVNHYVMPQCTPTRVALMTGRYPGRFGGAALQASNEAAFPIGTPTIASMFQRSGYETFLCGKWHLGTKPEHGPNHFGFDETYGSLAGAVGMYDHRYRKGEFYETWHRNGQIIDGYENGQHATDLIAGEAVRVIQRDRANGKPFFLYVPFHSVHTPLDERGTFIDRPTQLDPKHPKRWLNEDQIKWFNDPAGKIQRESDPEKRLLLAAAYHLDSAVGEVVAALDRSGQRQNTLILFSSDNGPQGNWKGNAYPDDLHLTDFNQSLPMRGMKTDVWEGGIHVPAFANWPGRIEAKQVTDPMHIVDWFPTLASLINYQPDQPIAWDGVDITPTLFENKALAKRSLYWTWNRNTNRWAVRFGDWKIVKYGRGAPRSVEDWQLFNLKDDFLEQNNLAIKHPNRVNELHQLFLQQRAKDRK